MSLTALVMMILGQGLVIVATGYFLYKVISIPTKNKGTKPPFSE